LSPPLPLFPPFFFHYFRFRLAWHSIQIFVNVLLFYSMSHVLGFGTILEPI
jgi:hypothetical protein